MDVVVGARSDVGRVRTQNEDSFFAGRQIWAVADGMGGAAAGDVASSIVVDQLRIWDKVDALTHDDLNQLVAGTNEAVLRYTRLNPGAAGMGSTVAGIASIEISGVRHWCVFNVGDSRVYHYVNGEMIRETVDHNEAEELIDAGQLDPADAAEHPGRFVLTRALGTNPAPRPDVFLLPQSPPETFLICSDGLTSEVSDDTFAAVLLNCPDPTQAANRLVDLALMHGARDNVTVVIVAIQPSSDTDWLQTEADETTIPRPDVQEN